MLSRLRGRLTFANVVSVIALFAALGLGTAWALQANSVKSKHIVNGQVKGVDVAPPENWHEVGTAGEPEFKTAGRCMDQPWANYDGTHNSAAFYRDPYGRVYLKGLVQSANGFGCPNNPGLEIDDIFALPAGYTPAKEIEFATSSEGQFARVLVKPDGTVAADPPYFYGSLYLDSISFRCAPPGENGCP